MSSPADFKVTRGKNQAKRKAPSTTPTPSTTTTPLPVGKKPRRSLESKTGERQGVDIRTFGTLAKPKPDTSEIKPNPETTTNTTTNTLEIKPKPEIIINTTNQSALNIASPSVSEDFVVPPLSPTYLANFVQNDVQTESQFSPESFQEVKPLIEQSELVIVATYTVNEAESTATRLVSAPEEYTLIHPPENQGIVLGGEEKKEEKVPEPLVAITPEVLEPNPQVDEITSTLGPNLEGKGVKRRHSTSSSSSKSSLKYIKKFGSCDISAAIERKDWHSALESLSNNLKRGTLPTSPDLARIISSCILKLKVKGRMTPNNQNLASDYFELLIKSDLATDSKLIPTTLELINDTQVRHWTQITMEELINEASLNLTRKVVLDFLRNLFLFVEKDYEKYLNLKIKLRQPVLVRILAGKDNNITLLNNNLKCMLNHIFELKKNPHDKSRAQIHTLLEWVNLVTTHYYTFYARNEVKEKLVSTFVDVVTDEGQEDYGFPIMVELKKKQYVQDIILSVLGREVEEIQLYPEHIRIKFMNEVCQLGIIRRHDIREEIRKLASNKRKSTSKVNIRGENMLHFACGSRAKNTTLPWLEKQITEMKASNTGDINVLDNALNTPLHEAAFHQRHDVIKLLRQNLYDPSVEPGPLNINIMAKNDVGDTPLHIAGRRGFKSVVKLLIDMATGDNDKLIKLVYSKNNAGRTPADVVKPDDPGLKEYIEGVTPEVNNYGSSFADIIISPKSVKNLGNENLQKLLAYWSHLESTKVN